MPQTIDSEQLFGKAVSMFAHLIVAGAPGAAAAHVFEREYGGGFAEIAMLTPSMSAPGFGAAVSVWGETAVVGAPGDSTTQVGGAVYVFERIDGEWLEKATLTARDAAAGARFGSAVHLAGDTLIVGAPGARGRSSRSGAAYVFTRTRGHWTEADKLRPSDNSAGAQFGAAVTVARDTAIVGAPLAHGPDGRAGAAYVFTRALRSWRQSALLRPADSHGGARFGTSVALRGDTALIGAPSHQAAGAVYAYARQDAWTREAVLSPPQATETGFGAAVSLAGDVAAVSARDMAGPGNLRGRVYVLERSQGRWSVSRRRDSDRLDDAFGAAVALTRTTLVVGAALDSDHASQAGALYAYEQPDIDSQSTDITCPDADTLGSLVTCIRSHMPREDSDGFVPPTTSEQDDWRMVVTDMLFGICNMSLPSTLDGIMRAQDFEDLENGQTYCVLMETLDGDSDGYVDRGWGTFIVNYYAQRELSQQAPHAYFESKTAVQAVDVFKGTESRTFLMCGAHRYANQTSSSCDTDYPISDCAHSKSNMYYPTVLELDAYYGPSEHTEIQWHGMSDSSCPDVNVYISHGLSSTPPESSNVNTLMDNVLAYHSDWDVDVPGSDTCHHHGTKNTEGRFLNGVPDPDVCEEAATSSTNRFIHIEQDRDYRDAADWIAPILDTWP